MLPFLQAMADRPLRVLRIDTGQRVDFGAAALAQLATGLNQLQLLEFGVGIRDRTAWVDWSDAAYFTSFAPACLSCLLSLTLDFVKLGAAAIVAFASAAPQLKSFTSNAATWICPPPVVCAILGGYCQQIDTIDVEDERAHIWKDVRAADVADAYRAAVEATGRSAAYKPFKRLKMLSVRMCWCTHDY